MKFRRRSSAPAESQESPDTPEATDAAVVEKDELDDPGEPEGPYDADDIDVEASGRVDLGSLLIAPAQGREVRVQVDEASQAVQAVLVAGPDGALELRAFAAPRHGDLWGEVRPQIVEDIRGRGGTVEEREGRFGPELVCEQPVQLPDGKSAVQPSRIVGVNGSRWFLRATFLGAPARPADQAGDWEDVLARVAVRRGSQAMPAGDALPITLPNDARRVR